MAEVILVSRVFEFLRVIYIGADKLENQEYPEPPAIMDAICLTILLVLFLATLGLVFGIDRMGADR